MSEIEKTVSNFIETQFPEFYLSDGPTFILFVKKYYEWLEGQSEAATAFKRGYVSFNSSSTTITGKDTYFLDDFEAGDRIALYYDDTEDNYEIFTIDSIDSDTSLEITEDDVPQYSSTKSLYGSISVIKNPNYHIRRFYEYDDVDTTPEEFLIYFKEKYLKNIQFTTKTNTRQLIKHCLDLYRSKGTPRSLDLLFKLVFGVGAKTYYPGQDIFRLSDGTWHVPKYLEISLNKYNQEFVNKQIVGLTSGATAFVEAVIRKNFGGKFIDVAYISSIKGNFLTGEYINTADEVIDNENAPYITGSLNNIDLPEIGTSENYVLGDRVQIYSSGGQQAIALVSGIANTSGTVEFDLIKGGYAYTANAVVLVSERVLVINSVSITANDQYRYVDINESIVQPMYEVTYVVGTGTFVEGSNLYHYYANNSRSANSVVLSVNATNSTAGTLVVSPRGGNLATAYIGSTGNTITANIVSVSNVSGSANIVGPSDKAVFKVNNTNMFQVGEQIFQANSITGLEIGNAVVTRIATDVGSNSFVSVSNITGTIVSGLPIMGKTTLDTANVLNVQLYMGIHTITNDFSDAEGNYAQTASGFLGNVTLISSGAAASLMISNTLLYSETIELNDDFLANIASVELDASTYGFPGAPTANAASSLISTLNYEEYEIGKLYRIQSQNKGLNYNLAPVVRIYEPVTFPIYKKDVIFELSSSTGIFLDGEVVTQAAPQSRGLVKFTSGSNLHVELLRYYNDNYFVTTGNSTTTLVGESSSTSANIATIHIDESSDYIGLNALIIGETSNALGAVTDLRIIDSGFNFAENEQVFFTSEDKPSNPEGQGVGHVEGFGTGKGSGYYKVKGGFLSDNKKLFDGLYYQEFSYEVRSSVTLNKYEEMLKQILHIPGTKYFGAFVFETKANTTLNSQSTKITSS